MSQCSDIVFDILPMFALCVQFQPICLQRRSVFKLRLLSTINPRPALNALNEKQ